jgi:hypothetical protein
MPLHATPSPFTLRIADTALDDLRGRLAQARWPDEPPWHTGTRVGYLQALAEYWRTGIDWRACEAELNRFAQ